MPPGSVPAVPAPNPGDVAVDLGTHGAVHMTAPAVPVAPVAPVAPVLQPGQPGPVAPGSMAPPGTPVPAGVAVAPVTPVVAPGTPVPAAPGTPAPSTGPTAEQFGVTADQFTKFFDTTKGLYNWEAHAREADYKAVQRGPVAPVAPVAPGTPVAPVAEIQTAVAAAGLNFDNLRSQINEKGDITPEDYAAFAKVGIPQAEIEGYIGYVTATAEARVENVMTAFGGEQAYNEMFDWAHKNMSQGELDGYDAMLNSDQYQVAVDALRTRAGLPPIEKGAVLAGNNANIPGGDAAAGFKNQDELNAAIQDPRYRQDPAYRAQVTARAGKSTYDSNPRSHASGL